MGDSVIRKTRYSGNIDREQTCPDKRIITVFSISYGSTSQSLIYIQSKRKLEFEVSIFTAKNMYYHLQSNLQIEGIALLDD